MPVMCTSVSYTHLDVYKRQAYNVILTSYNEANPWKLKDNKYYAGLLNSFSMSYPSNARNIQDLSKVKFGLVNYEEMIETDTCQKILTWEMDVFPDWDKRYLNIGNPFITELGLEDVYKRQGHEFSKQNSRAR